MPVASIGKLPQGVSIKKLVGPGQGSSVVEIDLGSNPGQDTC